jgi:hypothetical protein
MIASRGRCTRFVRDAACAVALLAVGSAHAWGQAIKFTSGQDIAPVFEGWQRNDDGSFTMYFGYLNRNYEEILDVPVGPDNRFEPAPLDRGQPTHFYPRRQRFVFTATVPKDWDKTKRLMWSITAHGKTETAQGWLQPEWEVDEGVIQMNIGPGGAPPDPPNHYPQVTRGSKQELTATVGAPLALSVSVTDDGIPKPRKPRKGAEEGPPSAGVSVRWLHYRGAGRVTFDPDRSERVYGRPFDASTKAIFKIAGTYVIRAVVSDGLLETPYDISVTVK